jgi:GxxExxY protein
MHKFYQRADELSHLVIGAAIEVHKSLGPGLLESIYERCLIHEIGLRGASAANQREIQIRYKDLVLDEVLRFDVLVQGCLLVEIKADQEILPIHKAQLLSYMKLLDIPLGLLIKFHEVRLIDGVTRLILPGANQ